ncbi:MAG: EthD domain-containing protein [Xanthobacteraceae bacterium]
MQTQPKLKIIYCLRRLPHLTEADFSGHWREVHAPLVEQCKSVLRIVRYVQSHTDHGIFGDRLRTFRGSPEPYDGVAEIWYESREALETLGRDPAARAASRELLDDERRFVDFARSPIFLVEEHTVIA